MTSQLGNLCGAVRTIGSSTDDLARSLAGHAAALQAAARRAAAMTSRHGRGASASAAAFLAAADACNRAAALLVDCGQQSRTYAGTHCGGSGALGTSAGSGAGSGLGEAGPDGVGLDGGGLGDAGLGSAAERIAAIGREGHAVARHLHVTDEQLKARAGTAELDESGAPVMANGFVKGTDQRDPETGTTTQLDGRPHICANTASRFDDEADFLAAYTAACARRETNGDAIVDLSIRDVLGPAAEERMTGFYIDPDRPAEYGRASYVGGIIRAIFRSDGTLKTMFPMAPLFRPLRR